MFIALKVKDKSSNGILEKEYQEKDILYTFMTMTIIYLNFIRKHWKKDYFHIQR